MLEVQRKIIGGPGRTMNKVDNALCFIDMQTNIY